MTIKLHNPIGESSTPSLAVSSISKFLEGKTASFKNFSDTMQPDSKSHRTGVIGYMTSTGLRSDNWQNHVAPSYKAEVLEKFKLMEKQLTNLLIPEGADITTCNGRNKFINYLQQLLQTPNKFNALSIDQQNNIIEASRELANIAQNISTSLAPEVSHLAKNIIEAAKRSKSWHKTCGSRKCLSAVTKILQSAFNMEDRPSASNPLQAVKCGLFKNSYPFRSVGLVSFSELKNAPLGSIACYGNPKGRSSHAAIKVANSTWVSDYKHGDFAYAGGHPRPGAKIFLYIPKDYEKRGRYPFSEKII